MAGRRVLTSLYEQFGDHLGKNRSDARLQEVAILLARNTAREFSDEEADPDRWIDQFSGANLRWESLGLLFSLREFCEESVSSSKGHIRQDFGVMGEPWAVLSRFCLGLCIDLARRFGSPNCLLLQLCIRRAIAESVVSGDAGKFAP